MPLTPEQLDALGLSSPPPSPDAAMGAESGARILPDQGASQPSAQILPDSSSMTMPRPSPAPTAPLGTIDWQRQRQHELMANQIAQENYSKSDPSGLGILGHQHDQLVNQITQMEAKKADPWGSPDNHPGILGKIGHIAAHVGNIAGDIVAPGTMANIPGTEMNNQLKESSLKEQLAQNEQRQQQATHQGLEDESLKAGTEHTQVETENLRHPQDKVGMTPEETTIHDLMSGNNGAPQVNPATKKPYTYLEAFHTVQQAKQDVKPEKQEKPDSPEQQFIDAETGKGISLEQAVRDYAKATQKEGGENAGTWALQEGADGKPVLFNSKTGQTREAPNGIQKTGTAAKQKAEYDKNVAGPEADLDYADTYTKNKMFTGAGDEALMEKFFDLAKPSSGFRMSQPQIDMQVKARSWMGSIQAQLRHATTGTWFSDEQRQQIADTMRQLHDSKTRSMSKGPSSGQGGGTQTKADPLGIR